MEENYDVIISGAGPSGLMSAWLAAKQNKKVLLISDRPKIYSRTQRVILDPDTRDQLIKMISQESPEYQIEHEQFIKDLYNLPLIAVKDVESFMLSCIEKIPQGKVTCLYESKIFDINLERGDCVITSIKDGLYSESFTFTWLIGADGAKHHAVNIFNRGMRKNRQITYEKIPSPKHDYHIASYVTIEKKDGGGLQLPTKSDDQILMAMVDDNETERSYLSIIAFAHLEEFQKVARVNFGGEIPEDIYHNNLPIVNGEDGDSDLNERVGNYIKNSITQVLDKYGYSNGELTVKLVHKSQKNPMKDKLRLVVFKTDLEQANRAVFEMNGHIFALVGDAYRLPNYQFAHGLNNGIAHARKLGEIFDETLSLSEYNNFCQQESEKWSNVTQLFESQMIAENKGPLVWKPSFSFTLALGDSQKSVERKAQSLSS